MGESLIQLYFNQVSTTFHDLSFELKLIHYIARLSSTAIVI